MAGLLAPYGAVSTLAVVNFALVARSVESGLYEGLHT